MEGLWTLLLVAAGGLLTGGTIAMWRASRPLALLLGLCAALAVVAGALRL